LADPSPAGQAPGEDRLRELARFILEERERRRWHFPRAVFDEIPWEMLLLLYGSEVGSLSTKALVNGILVAPAVVDRWSDYLEREGLVLRLQKFDGPPEFQLTPLGLASLELYLSDRLDRAESSNPQGRRAPGSGFPAWNVALLLLGTAILSALLTWTLAPS
jgi:hypothetical protein